MVDDATLGILKVKEFLTFHREPKVGGEDSEIAKLIKLQTASAEGSEDSDAEPMLNEERDRQLLK